MDEPLMVNQIALADILGLSQPEIVKLVRLRTPENRRFEPKADEVFGCRLRQMVHSA